MTHAYEVMELAKLSYPLFNENNIQIIAKDNFLKSLHTDMQVELKAKYPKLEEVTLSDIAKETTRLEIVGIKARSTSGRCEEVINAVDTTRCVDVADELVEKVAKKVSEVLKISEIPGESQVNYVTRESRKSWDQRKPNRGKGGSRNCWWCNSTEHLSRSCPERHCRNCGEQGHDPWMKICKKRK